MAIQSITTLPVGTIIVIVAFFVLACFRLNQVGRRPKDYPPGPPTLPIIGNLHQIPLKKSHKQFEKWAQEYGPVYSLILGTQVLIVLSTDQAVKDLLDRRSAIYSSRMNNHLAGEIFSGGMKVLLMPYGAIWRKVRILARRILSPKVSCTYIPYQDLENKAMLLGFLERPEHFIEHIRRYSSSLTTQMTYGFRIASEEDPRRKSMFEIFESFSEIATSPVAQLFDVFPILKYLPDFMLPIRKRAKKGHRLESDLFVGLYLDTKKQLENGTAKPSFCVDLARVQKEEGFSDAQTAYIGGSLLSAGSQTTAAILVGFVQALIIFPGVVKAAQEELDRVCGDSTPDLNDMENLPYIRGCIKESLRWMPTTLLGVPHAVIRDDEYLGFRIPKDAGVIYNVWAIHNDPRRHPDPRIFDPNRWTDDNLLSAESATNPDASKRDHFVFGAGRRLCQGTHIVDRSLFLAIARLLWAFDFKRTVDENTKQEIIPDMENLKEGLFAMPQPFKATITPRDQFKSQRVVAEWQKVSAELLDKDMQWKEVPQGLIWNDLLTKVPSSDEGYWNQT